MPSSTSSSESDRERGRHRGSGGDRGARFWTATWLLAALLAALPASVWEGFWRLQGFRPSVSDDPGLWAAARLRASRGGPEAVVLIGSSKMQMLDSEALARATGWRRPVQLAIAMGPAQPVLEDLADDPDFVGTLLVEVNPRLFFAASRSLDWIARGYLARVREFTLADRLEQPLRAALQQRLVSRLPDLAPRALRKAWSKARTPAPSHLSVAADRSRHADFRRFPDLARHNREVEARRRRTPWPYLGADALDAWLERIEDSVRRIQARGGRVVFLRLPSSGFVRDEERRNVPRERYWDVLAARTSAATVHFEDHPELAGFAAPDGTHLDGPDATAFSAALGPILLSALAESQRPSAGRSSATKEGSGTSPPGGGGWRSKTSGITR